MYCVAVYNSNFGCIVWQCITVTSDVFCGSVIMVLGAGRGPLVSAAIRASHQAARKIKVYAVEKNPNAVVTYET